MSIIGRLAKATRINNVNIIANGLHSSSTWHLDQKWRGKKRLPQNPNAFGPLTNLPDYTYADGRPSPFGVRQWGRIQQQRKILGQVRKLVHEVDDAVEIHARLEHQNAMKRREIVDGKLKPKGQCLLSDAKSTS